MGFMRHSRAKEEEWISTTVVRPPPSYPPQAACQEAGLPDTLRGREGPRASDSGHSSVRIRTVALPGTRCRPTPPVLLPA